MDISSLSHSKWNCKYHIVFASKYRRKVVYGELKQDIANILSILCKRKGVEIVEVCPAHVHMLVRIPSKKYKCIKFYRVLKRKEYSYNIRETCKSEI